MRDASTKNAAILRARLARSLLEGLALATPAARVCACAILLAITQLWPLRSAHAEPLLALRWSTPPGNTDCPDLAWAQTRIETQLGQPIARDVARGVNADVAIVTHEKGFALTLRTTWNGETGARTIEGARCAELSEAAILIVALSVSEAHEQAQAAANVAAASSEPPASTGSAKPPDAPATPARPSAGLRGFVRVDALLDVWLWSRPAFGPGLTLGLEQGMFRAELSGLWFPPLTMHKQGLDIDASLGAARAAGCLLFGAGRVRGGGCLGVEFGGVRANNSEGGRQPRTWWGTTFVGGRLHVQLFGPVSLVATAELLVTLTKLRFSRQELPPVGDNTSQPTGDTLHESQRLQLRASFGPELRF